MASSPTSLAKPSRDVAAELSWRLVRADKRPAETVAFEEAVIAFFLESADLLGVPKSVAMVYGICFASPLPLSFSEVRERLDISAGSVSQGLRVLCEIGALKIVRNEFTRRDCYTPDMARHSWVMWPCN